MDMEDVTALFFKSSEPICKGFFDVSARWADHEFGSDVFDVNMSVFDGARFEDVGVNDEEIELVLNEGVTNGVVGFDVFACGQDGGVIDEKCFGWDVGAFEMFV